ncbi:complexin-2 isoform X1 [Pan troglodytes]|uniref:complexin-2 isoform X1 n=1 Tax=Pan troglodytes TaxID=9598 RepID=UPI00020E34E2|nr:complexin-2 isoform X1 [Pan troglodytes]
MESERYFKVRMPYWQTPKSSNFRAELPGWELSHVSLISLPPLLASSLISAASPRLLSREAWVSLGAGLPLGGGLWALCPAARQTFEADRNGAWRPPRARVLAQAGGSASAEESRKRGREKRARTSVPGALVGRGGAAASNRKVWSLPCYLLCSATEGACIPALPGSKGCLIFPSQASQERCMQILPWARAR